jgi:hypothetical protein
MCAVLCRLGGAGFPHPVWLSKRIFLGMHNTKYAHDAALDFGGNSTHCSKINGAARNLVKICEKIMRGGRKPHRAQCCGGKKAAMPARYFLGSVTR